jgi:hypothetical protein
VVFRQFAVASLADIEITLPIAEDLLTSEIGNGQGAHIAGDRPSIFIDLQLMAFRTLVLAARRRTAVHAVSQFATPAPTRIVILQAVTATRLHCWKI